MGICAYRGARHLKFGSANGFTLSLLPTSDTLHVATNADIPAVNIGDRNPHLSELYLQALSVDSLAFLLHYQARTRFGLLY